MGICNSKGGNSGNSVAKDNNPGRSCVNNSMANNTNNSGENNNNNPRLNTNNNSVLNNNSNPGTNNNNNPGTNNNIYSCIPRIEKNYNDLSYETLQNDINNSIKKIEKKKGNTGFSFNNYNEEFEKLQKNIDIDQRHKNALEIGVPDLDRYTNIKAYQHNSLKINANSRYINASPITINGNLLFISTQGPTDNTKDDFWRMNDEKNCNLIIMLCNLIEDGKKKCSDYWSVKETQNYFLELLPTQNQQDKNIEERKIKLKSKANSSEKIITQIHYKGWPDHGVPDIRKEFNSFLYMIQKVDELKGNGPVVTHCSAGVGRTGTFISIYILYQEIMAQIKNEQSKEIKFSVFNMVRKLKEMRLHMVQNLAQYKFIYTFIDCLLQKFNK
jgi:protein tyrosine phosphatase